MEKIKVIHFVSGLKSGGVEMMITNFAKRLREECEFTVVYQHQPDEKCYHNMIEAGCELIRIPSKSKHPLKNVLYINKLLKNKKYDVIHSHMNLTSWIPLLVAKMRGINNRVNHSHIAKDEKDGKAYRLFAKVCKKMILYTSNYYVACGEDAARYMYGQDFYEDDRHLIIRNAIDIDRFKFNQNIRDSYRNELNVEGMFVVGHVGRFTKQKNHKFLIDVFSHLVENEKNAFLLLIGSGELLQEVKNYVKEKDIEDRVCFLGNRNDVCNIMQAIDVFILPSLYEGLPVVSIEAQASGVDCLFSDTIDEKCKIHNNVSFLSITEGTNVWVEGISACKRGTKDRARAYEVLKIAGYDVSSESIKLKNLYVRLRSMKGASLK